MVTAHKMRTMGCVRINSEFTSNVMKTKRQIAGKKRNQSIRDVGA